MTPPPPPTGVDAPDDPPIFHITHLANLAGIVREGGLWCDQQRVARGLTTTNIAYGHIKSRRLEREVPVAAGGALGSYVPFNFCPRSVMLYPISTGRTGVADGQARVLHLVSSVTRAIATGRPWAFTDRHAELQHALYFDHPSKLGEVPWAVMRLVQWSEVKEQRQAEFLVHQFFPWTAITQIACLDATVAEQVRICLEGQAHQPAIEVRSQWYY
jgi:hypothetical protein